MSRYAVGWQKQLPEATTAILGGRHHKPICNQQYTQMLLFHSVYRHHHLCSDFGQHTDFIVCVQHLSHPGISRQGHAAHQTSPA